MRPSCAPARRQRVDRLADRRGETRRRRLQVVAAALERGMQRGALSGAQLRRRRRVGRRAGVRPSAAKTVGVDDRHARIGEHREQRRDPERRPEPLAAPVITRARGDRQTGTSAPTAAAAS